MECNNSFRLCPFQDRNFPSNSNAMKKISALLLILACMIPPAHADVINVPADKSTIQAGIDSASTGDTVLVEEDTYFENINFKGKAITVASRFILDGDTTHIYKTIIDGSH
jgi:hypothetical protein